MTGAQRRRRRRPIENQNRIKARFTIFGFRFSVEKLRAI